MELLGKGFYVGQYEHNLDAKNRLTIPSKWRFEGDQKASSYLALPNPNGSITVYPPRMMEQLENKIAQVSMLGEEETLRALTRIFSRAERFGCDKQGRINLTEKLTIHAEINKAIVLVGVVNTFHLWSPDRYALYLKREGSGEDKDILVKLGL